MTFQTIRSKLKIILQFMSLIYENFYLEAKLQSVKNT